MGILRTDRVSGLGGANAITGSTFFGNGNGTAGNYLRVGIDSTEDFAFGLGDFTIEFWFNRALGTHQQHFYDFRGTTNASTVLVYMVNNTMYYFGSGSERITSGNVPSNKWVHFALVRSSGSTKMYFDGVQTGSTYSDSINVVGPDEGSGYIGSNGGTDGIIPSGSYLSAHLSNFRVQKGKAEYTAAFTPPTHRLEKTPETVLLTCNSSSDVTNEETGKVITPERDTLNDALPQASRFTPNSPVGFSTTTDVGTQFGSTFDGVTTFDSQAYMVPPAGNTRERNRGRGVIRGGMTPNSSALTKIIQYIEMSSGGNTIDFGDGSVASYGGAGLASATRGVYSVGATANSSPFSLVNTLEFITIANTANAIDFGDLYFAIQNQAPLSNQTRGIFAAGLSPASRVRMDFITIATTGNAQDFGDVIGGSYGLNQGGQAGSSTRGLIAGGSSNSAPAEVEKIQFVTFASLGDAQDFGDLVDQNGYSLVGASSDTRALFAGGGNIGSPFVTVNTIQFVTIATTGNATDFGDLTATRYSGGGLSNSTRGCFAGGVTYPGATRQNIIDFVIIASTGNASDFGDVSVVNVNSVGTMSDSHGGL